MANHEDAIAFLADSRDHWLRRVEKVEDELAAHKENIIRLREEKEAAVAKVSHFDASIAALKSAG